jgi:uncharacterized membrane protein YjjP (DUF1212 family)
MAAVTDQGPVLLAKKFGAMLALILGAALTAYGYSESSTATMVVGVVLFVLGIVLLALKIIRRNQPG